LENCKKSLPGKKGSRNFKKIAVVLSTKPGWKLADDRKSITFTDKNEIGKLKPKGLVICTSINPTKSNGFGWSRGRMGCTFSFVFRLTALSRLNRLAMLSV
jgi:hypothetical protein